MKKYLLVALTISSFSSGIFAQLISGPVLGYCDMREIGLAMEVGKNVKGVTILYKEIKSKNSTDTATHKGSVNYTGALGKEFNPIQIKIGGLKMDTEYSYEVLINGKTQPIKYPLKFKTKKYWASYMKDGPPNFSFLIGSCTYINDSLYDRPGKPYGQGNKIFETMADTKADFMIWSGDNLYLREADYGSEYGIRYRYSKNFSTPELQKLFAIRPNYATWDDHDFGPNDSNFSFGLKDITTECFKSYWPNQTYGENGSGIYQKFQMYDSEFFMLDNRTFRSANELNESPGTNIQKNFLGRRQLDWLFNSLIASNATFKFIVSGSQVLNPIADKECYRQYKAEFDELMTFIITNKIQGVIFLSGDRHFSEIIKIENPGFYPLYDFTCSPLSSGVHNINNKPEFTNPNRVPGTLLQENNFGKISISGPKKERTVKIETFDVAGNQKWDYSIKESELKIKKD